MAVAVQLTFQLCCLSSSKHARARAGGGKGGGGLGSMRPETCSACLRTLAVDLADYRVSEYPAFGCHCAMSMSH